VYRLQKNTKTGLLDNLKLKLFFAIIIGSFSINVMAECNPRNKPACPSGSSLTCVRDHRGAVLKTYWQCTKSRSPVSSSFSPQVRDNPVKTQNNESKLGVAWISDNVLIALIGAIATMFAAFIATRKNKDQK